METKIGAQFKQPSVINRSMTGIQNGASQNLGLQKSSAGFDVGNQFAPNSFYTSLRQRMEDATVEDNFYNTD